MEYRQLGASDYRISRIGFGAWAAGGGKWAFALGPQDDADTIAAIRRAVELGVNWIDTAPLYGLGHSEEVVAKAIADLDEKPFIFTKCGMPWDENGRITHSLRRESIFRECEASLRRLNTDVIDLYQIHWNKPAEDVEEGLEAVARLREQGKVRYTGISNFNVSEISLAMQLASPVSLQPPYSLVDRLVEGEILPFCASKKLGVIVYSPLQSGLLSGKMTRERILSFPDDDLRRNKAEFQEPQLSRNLAIVDRLNEVAARHNASPAEAAIAWTLSNSCVTAAIVGARNPEQIEGIVGAASLSLSPSDTAFLTQERHAAPRPASA